MPARSYASPFERVMDALRDRGEPVRAREGKARTRGLCHDGDAPDTVSIDVGKDKQVLIHCFKDCPVEDFVAALGLTMADLFPEPKDSKPGKLGPPVVSYAYEDTDGSTRYWVDRFVPKTFRPRLPDGSRSLPKAARILYRRPAVAAAARAGAVIDVVEGEKDADSLTAAGAVATTMPGGVGTGWSDSYTADLAGAAGVNIIADRDTDGQGLKHARKVAASLARARIPHRIWLPAVGKDISDHLAAGLGRDALLPLGDEDDPPPEPDEGPPEDGLGEQDPLTSEQAADAHFEARVAALSGELLDTDALDHIPALEPIIDDVLFKDTLARIYGASGTFKSFMTLDFAGCVGVGMDWHGQRVQQGEVIYLVAEGIKGIRKRVRAWEQHYGVRMTGVKFLPRPVQAMDPEWLVLIELCRRLKPALIVVDTQARVTVGIEENSNTEMGRVVDRMEQLRGAAGACVLLVHHSGHDSDRGRGATAVKGALQTEIGVERKGKGLHDSQVTLKTGKQKDDEELSDITFGLHQVKLDGEAKEDGSPVTSIVLVPISDIGQPQATTGHQGVIEELAAALDAAGVPSRCGRDRLREECSRLGIKARNELLGEVAKHRKNRPPNLSPGRPAPVPDSPQPHPSTLPLAPQEASEPARGIGPNAASDLSLGDTGNPQVRPVPDSSAISPQVQDRSIQTNHLSPISGQGQVNDQVTPVPDRSGTDAGQGSAHDLSPSPPSFREGTGRDSPAPQPRQPRSRGRRRGRQGERPQTPCQKCHRPQWNAIGSPYCADCRPET